jgi:AAA family ATP:ADP antiporter
MPDPSVPDAKPSPFDRLLRLFGDVHAGEGLNCVLLFANIFLLLVAYYILKTVREPLILATGGAELKTYASAVQAALLLFYVPAYGWVAGRLPPRRLVVAVVIFFVACIQVFVLGRIFVVPYTGFAFYVWVGIFSLTCIAQFWSFANDIYAKPEGDRLFPIIAIGATAGAPLGAWLAQVLFAAELSPWVMMEIASGLLVAHLLLYLVVRTKGGQRDGAKAAGGGRNGFALVMESKYLRLIALLLVLLNIVNTTGEYILANLVTEHARTVVTNGSKEALEAYIGEFYGSYFFWVNIVSVTAQALLVSRVARLRGLAGVVLALPIVAFGAYAITAIGASMAIVRWIKTAENAADYSFMNTAKQMLWLPTTREQKYKGKQAIDTFFVRFGDMLAAGVVFVGTNVLTLSSSGFALTNVVLVVGGLVVAWLLLRESRRISVAPQPA